MKNNAGVIICRIFSLFILLQSVYSNLNAQEHIRLTQNWEFLKEDLGSVWEAVRPYQPGDPQSVPLWQRVTLPHCFNARDAVDPDVNYYEGPGWYRTQLVIDNPYKSGRTLLHFEGAGQKTEVYVFMTKVGSHVGGYDQWTVDMTRAIDDFLKSPDSKRFHGKIPIEIRCDNSRDVEMIPSDMADFTIYGGLYRNVEIQYVPAISLNKFHVNPIVEEDGKIGKVSLSASFYDSSKIGLANLQVEIYDPYGKRVSNMSKQLPVELNYFASLAIKKPILWSPTDPKLYTVKILLHTNEGDEERIIHFGFRYFKFITHGPFLLNGKRLLLRGTHRHQDWAGVGAAETDEMVRREFELMKNMGVNFIRLGHYQQSSFVLNLCDSLGLLVWEEIPWNRGGLGNSVYRGQARRMLTNMIMQHYNHPSIIIWSLGNEIDWPGDFPQYYKDSIRSFLKDLNNLSHQLDPGRVTAIRRCDFCRDIVDLYSPSIWAGWYSGIYTQYRTASKRQMERVKHFFHAEWGADGVAGRHAENPYKNIGEVSTTNGVAEKTGDASLTGGEARVSKDGDWSETYQCDLIDWYLKEQENMPWLTGSAYWIFKDFATPLRPDNPIAYVNTKGVVQRDLTPKESYYVFQSYWSSKPMVHIYGHSWPVRWGDEGAKKTIKVYSNCTQAELFVDDKSWGIRKRNTQDYPASGLRWLVPLTGGEHHFKVIAQKGNTVVSDEIVQEYQTAKWGKPSRLLLKVMAIKNDTATIEAKLCDAKNILCLDARNKVRFGLTGDGDLLDDLGTSSGSRVVEMYNGRAIIKVKLNEGKSMFSVASAGIPTSFTTL
ncbi:glycoside hydrolase family 2 protein [Arachidicoccus sp.]|uniref:glycoside hydrolase family 2 protein n=1 Tax=Arachidicoccus sp. TaxID=1872624 RepID=UPI003D1F7D1B